MEIKIDKNVPIPPGAGARASVYPFEDMEVGDSFFAAGKTSDQLTNAGAHYRKKNGWGFSARNTEEMGIHPETGAEAPIKGARIWRTK
jgi:hypothetical protein